MADRIIQVTACDIQTEHQAEFHQWYNQVHLPEVLACPGWRSAARFESLDGQPQFLAIYELDNADAWDTPEFERAKGWGPIAPYVINSHPRMYREIFTAREP